MTKTATDQLHGNRYEVDAALVGRTVELVFDPFDLTAIEVRCQGRAMGTRSRTGSAATSTPRPDPTTPPPPPTPTGIDYLGLVDSPAHRRTGRPGPLLRASRPRPTGRSRLATAAARPDADDRRRRPDRRGASVIEKLQAHYGFTRMPFGRALAPADAAPPRAPTPKPSPGSAGASANAASA